MADQEVKVRISSDPSSGIDGINKFKTSMSGLESHTGSLVSRIKSHWLGLSASIGAAMYAAKKAWDLAEAAAGYIEQMQQLDALASKYDTTSTAIVSRIREIGDGMISMSTASQVALSALGKGLSPDKIYGLAEAAVTLKDIMGKTANEAFTELSSSLEVNKQKALKLAIGVIDLKDRYGDLADKMTEAEKQTAFYDLIMEKTHEIQARLGNSTKSIADRMESLKVTISDLKIELGIGLIKAGAGAMGLFQSLAAAALKLSQGIFIVVQGYYAAREALAIGSESEKYYAAKGAEWKVAANAAGGAAGELWDKAKNNFAVMTTSTADMVKAQGKLSGAFDDTSKSVGKTDKEMERLLKSWNEMEMTLDSKIEGRGMSELTKDLIQNQLEADKLYEKFSKLPTALKKVAYEKIEKAQDVDDESAVKKAEKVALDAFSKRIEEQTALDKKAWDDRVSAQKDYHAMMLDTEESSINKIIQLETDELEKYKNYLDDKLISDKQYEEGRKRIHEKTTKEIAAENSRAFFKENQDRQDSFSSMAENFTAMSQLYAEGSRERQALSEASKVATIAEIALQAQKNLMIAVGAVVNQGTGDPYSAFARIAAMVALVSNVLQIAGLAFGGGASVATPSVSHKSTVLGAEDDTGSESIANSLAILADTYDMENVRLKAIYEEMRDLNSNIKGLVTSIVRTGGIQSIQDFGITVGTTASNLEKSLSSIILPNLGILTDIGNHFLKPTIDIANFLFGGETTVSVNETGIAIGKTIVSSILSGSQIAAQQYASGTTTTTGGLFEGDDVYGFTKYAALDDSVTRMFTLVYKNMGETLVTISKELGTDTQTALDYVFKSTKINLKGMTTEEMNTALSEYFSNIADTAAETLFGDLISQYQQLDEGLYETAVRLVSDKATIERILELTNQTFHGTTSEFIKFSESLITVAGSLDALTDAYSTYYDAFFSDAEKQADYKKTLSNVLASYGYSLPTTREGYRDIVETPGISQQAYYALMAISGTADKYYDYLEAAANSIDINASDFATSIEYQRALAALPKYADGGYTPGGYAIVGESGPELVNFGSSARVYSNKDSKDILSSTEIIAAIKELQAEVRKGNVVIATNTLKVANKTDKWDRNGMPATTTS